MKAILISAIYQNDENTEYYIQETTTLAETLDIEICETFTQKLDKKNGATYLHKGKIEEIKNYIDSHEIELVIVQEEISAAIERNLTKIFDCKVIDRTNIILDIFFSHAKSKLAKTQIEIARLEYNLTKVIGSYSNLEKQGSSAVSRSSGESKAELDKRLIREQILKLKRSLETSKKTRESKRQKRKESTVSIVSLVGYTNVGKSTLLNSLMSEDKQILAKDQLFATLDTSVRKVSNKKYGNYLFIDTVGFVSNLPHHLVEAFASTFEEILESDVIIHVHDASDEYQQIHHQIVVDTLSTLYANEIPVIEVYNKIDLIDSPVDGIGISAKENIGMDQLFDNINTVVNDKKKLLNFFFDYQHMKEYNYFKQNFVLESEVIDEKGIILSTYVNETIEQIYRKFIVW